MPTDDGSALGRAPAYGFARYREFVPAGAGALIAVLVLLLARDLPAPDADTSTFGPSWWPAGICGLLLVLGAIQAVAAVRHSRTVAARAPTRFPDSADAAEDDAGEHLARAGVSGGTDDGPAPATRVGAVRLVAMLAAIGGYGVLWYYIDFRVSTTILFVALSLIAGVRGVKALVLFPVLATAVLWVLFGLLLRVPI